MSKLTITRKAGESFTVHIAGGVRVEVCEIRGKQVRILIEADPAVRITRDDMKSPEAPV